MKNNSPTTRSDRQELQKRPISACRAHHKPPRIFVKTYEGPYHGRMREAHLRNKRGYVYLCWRENGTVRNFYLGKAPRSCPTTAAGSSSPDGAVRIPARRARISPKNRVPLPQDAPISSCPTRSMLKFRK